MDPLLCINFAFVRNCWLSIIYFYGFYQNICLKNFLDKFIKSIWILQFCKFLSEFFSLDASRLMQGAQVAILIIIADWGNCPNLEIWKLFCITETFPDWFKSIKIWGLISSVQTQFKIINCRGICYRYGKCLQAFCFCEIFTLQVLRASWDGSLIFSAIYQWHSENFIKWHLVCYIDGSKLCNKLWKNLKKLKTLLQVPRIHLVKDFAALICVKCKSPNFRLIRWADWLVLCSRGNLFAVTILTSESCYHASII